AVEPALFTPGSVLHVAGFAESALASLPADAVVELGVSRAGFDAMTRFIHDEYQQADEGRTVPLARGLYGTGWFYAARSRYHLFNTCNTWVARALQQAGIRGGRGGPATRGGGQAQGAARGGPALPPPDGRGASAPAGEPSATAAEGAAR